MGADYLLITEEFVGDLDAIRSLVEAFSDPHSSEPKARIAAANSATLLLAATFEEFIREMARAHARAVVAKTESFEKLPRKLASTAWQRTLVALARIQIGNATLTFSAESEFSDALTRFNAVYEFCKGDLSQDIYGDLIHNENNMRPQEINSLFKVSDLGDVCSKLADKKPLLDNFGESEASKTHGRLLESLNDFFERRNGIAHSLNPARSSGPDQILKDIDMFDAFGKSLCETLDALAPTAIYVPDKSTPNVSQTPATAADTPAEWIDVRRE